MRFPPPVRHVFSPGKGLEVNFQIPLTLLHFLSACLYGDAKSYYRQLDEEGRSRLETEGKTFDVEAWFYRYLNDVLPDEKRAKYQLDFQVQQVQALRGKVALDRLCGVLRDNGLRFVLFKGADLAYRLYPEPVLRRFVDWDVWFHPDDCDRVLSVLAADGWKIPQNREDQEESENFAGHHYPPHDRRGYRVEPHYTFANFGGMDPHEIWEFTTESPAGGGQRVLSPEMNLLMLTRHAASSVYFHAHIPRLLTDSAVILRNEPVDFARLRAMADRWRLPYPGDLLAAFPEFFPADVLKSFHADPSESALFREIFERREGLNEPKNSVVVLNRFHARGKLVTGVLNHLRSCGPAKMRLVYHLPEQGAWGRVMWAYVCYFWSRFWQTLGSCVRPDRGLRDYVRIVEGRESGRKADRRDS